MYEPASPSGKLGQHYQQGDISVARSGHVAKPRFTTDHCKRPSSEHSADEEKLSCLTSFTCRRGGSLNTKLRHTVVTDVLTSLGQLSFLYTLHCEFQLPGGHGEIL
ncbi:unnamed protein product [Hydatigera taeniaeformis]|uniref:Uncharacterized protein n=1 Tax=Hydatigena taeniaeformis TaxID=6205 RepID=A0A0R3XD08_HYDTA|nr:unnamed protein product [Hydatigera taeniaeformis]